MKRNAVISAYAIVFTCATHGQNTGSTQPAFDAASVKIADTKIVRGVSGKMKGGPGTSDPGRITYTQQSLLVLLAKAFNIEYYRIIGPRWLEARDSAWYTLELAEQAVCCPAANCR